MPNLTEIMKLIQTQTQAGSFLCSVTVSNIDHEALDGPRVFHQLLTFRGAQNVLSLSGGSASIRRDFCSFFFFFFFLFSFTFDSYQKKILI